MFKCSECNQIYETKPEYCECGNDVFLEEEEKISKKSKNINLSNKDIISWIIFGMCILLALLIWLFAWNINPNSETQKKDSVPKIDKSIPDIDSIWNDSPKTGTSTQKPTSKTENQSQNINTIWNDTTPSQTQPLQKTEQKKNEPAPITQLPKRPAQPPLQSPANKTAKKNTPQPKTEQSSVKAENHQEMNNYKIALRSTLFANLKITSVNGKGYCEVSFSVDKNGKLTERNFTKLSENKSMNDAVYYMFMSLPQYYPPPPSYKGEKITMTFLIDNGYYEINYK